MSIAANRLVLADGSWNSVVGGQRRNLTVCEIFTQREYRGFRRLLFYSLGLLPTDDAQRFANLALCRVGVRRLRMPS